MHPSEQHVNTNTKNVDSKSTGQFVMHKISAKSAIYAKSFRKIWHFPLLLSDAITGEKTVQTLKNYKKH